MSDRYGLTAREVLATFLPSHDEMLHSVASVEMQGGTAEIQCTCGVRINITRTLAKSRSLSWEEVLLGLRNAPRSRAA